MNTSERNRILQALWIPLLAVVLIAAIYYGEVQGVFELRRFGIRPREARGLIGILMSPFLHGSFEHLFNNSLPLLVLGWSLFYFYPSLAWRTILWVVGLGGLWVWLSGRVDTNHIGASGLIYGLVTFLFFSGVIRKYVPLIAISMLVVFLYGGLAWGVLPIQEHISWEGHLMGAVAGTVMAFYYRPAGPQRPKYAWELEPDDDDDDDPNAPWRMHAPEGVTMSDNARPYRIVYHMKRKKTVVQNTVAAEKPASAPPPEAPSDSSDLPSGDA